MDSKGVMQQIRDLLAQGKISAEVIAMGYKPPTVYKVARQLRRAGKVQGSLVPLEEVGRRKGGLARNAQPLVNVSPSVDVIQVIELHSRVKELEEEKEELEAANQELRADLTEHVQREESLGSQLAHAQKNARGWQSAFELVKSRGEGDVRRKEERVEEAERLLQEAKAENTRLREFLSRCDPDWERLFRRYLDLRSGKEDKRIAVRPTGISQGCTYRTSSLSCTLARPNRPIVVCR